MLPYTYTYIVTVADGKGGSASQRVPVTLACPEGKAWGYDPAADANGCIVNQAPSIKHLLPLPSAVADQPYRAFTALGTDPDRQTLIYGLTGQPQGMSVGSTSATYNSISEGIGRLVWEPGADMVGQTFNFSLTLSDQVGGTVDRTINLHVCASGQTYSETAGACVANHPPVITSTPPRAGPSYPGVVGATVGQPFSFAVVASDPENDGLAYSVGFPYAWLSVDATGHLNGIPTESDTTAGVASTIVAVTDGKGGVATQWFYLLVCPAETPWSEEVGGCGEGHNH